MEATQLANALLAWYDRDGRTLPWRVKGSNRADPYRVWLSEIMLQQTTVVTVIPYFQAFTARWPTVAALAAADLDDILAAWAGLGYYARARNLHACAKAVVERHGGAFPSEEEELRALPGIGVYTAAAIRSIAFGLRAVVVDGNVERVMARLYAVQEPLPAVKPRLTALAAGLAPELRCGDYSQALMDLGATLCTPRSPACGLCPWMAACEGRRQGLAETLPARLPKPVKPVRHGVMFWLVRWDGAVLLRRRPSTGLLGGMMEIPSTPWRDTPWQTAEALPHAPLKGEFRALRGGIRHTFTHFHLDLTVVAATVRDGQPTACSWVAPDDLAGAALPTVMRKVIRHAAGQDS